MNPALFFFALVFFSPIKDKGREPMSRMEFKDIYWQRSIFKYYKGETAWTAVDDVKVDFIETKLATALLKEEITQESVGFNREREIIVRKFFLQGFGWIFVIEEECAGHFILNAIRFRDKVTELIRKYILA